MLYNLIILDALTITLINTKEYMYYSCVTKFERFVATCDNWDKLDNAVLNQRLPKLKKVASL